ncbi:MAG TPA: DUF262 domain-containing protein [Candidatus Portnoybacteria bacterium]|nr:DUF262 domain-containing protein [Candidatus Portnoybacteria bacterium]
MANDYIGKSTDKKLLELFNDLNDKKLILRPKFQRNLVWNDRHKEKFIETILLKLPFPEVYFCDGDMNMESRELTRHVVDGQQRLNAIYNYIKGDLKCKTIKSFNDLDEKEQRDFFNYNVVVRDLGDIDDERIKQIFERINSVNYALNATEIRKALYDGEFISVAKNISGDKILEKINVFSENQLSRMKDIELILLIMSTIETNGYFTRDYEVGNLISGLNDDYPNKNKIKRDILDVFRLIIKLNLPSDSIWFRLSSFFTLTIELIKYKSKEGKLLSVKALKNKLLKLEKALETNKNKNIETNEYAKYYYYVYQATASKAARIFRGKIVEEALR